MLKRPVGADRRWTLMWLAWIAAFFLIEGSALARHRPQDTLSDHCFRWFGIPQHAAPARSLRARRIALLWLLAWLATHLLSGDDV